MRRVDLAILICMATLTFLPLISATNVRQNQDTSDYTSSNPTQTVNIELNFNGPIINIYPRPVPPEFNSHLARQQPDFASWGGWYFAGIVVLVFGFVFWPRYRTEQKPNKGRNAAVASGRPPTAGDGNHIRGAAEGASSHSSKRGKQLATQDSRECLRPNTPPLWVTEYSTPVKTNDRPVRLRKVRQPGRSSAVDQSEKTGAYDDQEPPGAARPTSRSRPSAGTRGPRAPIAGTSPQKASLFGRVRWFILAVAVNYERVKDPENDLKFWITALWDSTHQRVTFKSLSGSKATLKSIEKELTSLYQQVWMTQETSRSNLLIYLTGEGNSTGGMRLSDGASIGTKDVELWLRKLQEKWKLDRPPTVLFDMCRYGATPNEPIVQIGASMNVVYSCSPGEGALAISLCHGLPETLFSAFSLAFAMTACASAYSPNTPSDEASAIDPDGFKEAVQKRLGQLTNVVNVARRLDLVAQNPDWKQAGDLDLVIDLVEMISQLGKVRRLVDSVAHNKYYYKANPMSDSAPDYSPKLQNYTTEHRRGKNVPPTCS